MWESRASLIRRRSQINVSSEREHTPAVPARARSLWNVTVGQYDSRNVALGALPINIRKRRIRVDAGLSGKFIEPRVG
jgi:hypothetical protein